MASTIEAVAGATQALANNESNAHYLWLVPLFPLIGAFINALFGARLQKSVGKVAVHTVAIGVMVLAAIVSWAYFFVLLGMPAEERFLYNHVFTMFDVGVFTASMSFAMDQLSGMMMLIITTIGTGIHIYSTGYMADEKAYWRFFCYLNLFVFSMLLLVMGSNFIVMFFGWEGVGLCSYLLIGFWYTERKNASAGMKAFVVNRVGDFAFITGLMLLFWGLGGTWTKTKDGSDNFIPASDNGVAVEYIQKFEKPQKHGEGGHGEGHEEAHAAPKKVRVELGPTLEFRELKDQFFAPRGGKTGAERIRSTPVWGFSLATLVAILFFIGATGKSAQIPLYVWLPDAMAGPTPVSALIHAATMVTAGVYMIARLNFLFALSPVAMTVITGIGVLTALFAATIGLFQYDIKKVLAYSTVSQLGFMFIGVGVGAWWAGVFHLLTHACFKACLFLGSGSVILGSHHEQDMRKMGGLKKYMPSTARTYLLACISIAGFPIAAGFYSKDEILWKAYNSGNHLAAPWIGHFIWLAGFIAAFGTAFYMFRSYYMTFTGKNRLHQNLVGTTGADGMPETDEALAEIRRKSSQFILHRAAGRLGFPWTKDSGLRDNAPAPETHAHHGDHGHGDHGHGHDAHGHGHDDHGHGHGHGGKIHESPRSMTAVLWFLAIASIVVGPILGFPALIGHLFSENYSPLLEHWLEPVFAPGESILAHPSRADAGHSHTAEALLILASIAIATLGWFLARSLYKDERSRLPERLKARFRGIHRLVYNKYYVDEVYNATVVGGTTAFAAFLSWFDRTIVDGLVNATGYFLRGLAKVDGLFDKYVVDGVVNGVAEVLRRGGNTLRRLQSGRVQTYTFVVLAGVILLALIIQLAK